LAHVLDAYRQACVATDAVRAQLASIGRDDVPIVSPDHIRQRSAREQNRYDELAAKARRLEDQERLALSRVHQASKPVNRP
jgi:hypothetical protein